MHRDPAGPRGEVAADRGRVARSLNPAVINATRRRHDADDPDPLIWCRRATQPPPAPPPPASQQGLPHQQAPRSRPHGGRAPRVPPPWRPAPPVPEPDRLNASTRWPWSASRRRSPAGSRCRGRADQPSTPSPWPVSENGRGRVAVGPQQPPAGFTRRRLHPHAAAVPIGFRLHAATSRTSSGIRSSSRSCAAAAARQAGVGSKGVRGGPRRGGGGRWRRGPWRLSREPTGRGQQDVRSTERPDAFIGT